MAYRDDREAALLYRDQIFQQKRAELAAVPGGLVVLYRRRAARAAAGLAGALGGVALLLAGLYAILAQELYGATSPPDGSVTAFLVAAWALAGLGYGLARRLAPRALLRPLERALSPTEDPHADIARAEQLDPLAALRERVVAREPGSLRWPLVALALLAPLSLHLLVAVLSSEELLHLQPPLFEYLLQNFDAWIGMSALLTGLSHLVLAGFAWRFASLARRCPTEELERRLGWYGWKALGAILPPALLCVALLFGPGGRILYEVAIILGGIVVVTGLAFVPWVFRFFRRRLYRERQALDGFGA